MNIADAFEFQAFYHPAALAVCVPGSHYGPVSYGRLRAFANAVGRRCLGSGIRPNDVVAILTNDPVFHLAAILALKRIGAVSLSAGQTILPDEFTIDAVITDLSAAIGGCEKVLRADRGWLAGDSSAIPRNGSGGYETDAARIVLTSATTGDPKGIALTQEMLVKRMHACDAIFGDIVPTCARIFLDIGLTTSWGYLWAMKILARGGAVFFRGTDPAETLQAFGLYNVQCMIGSPASAGEFVGYYESSPDFVCPFETMLSSGGMLTAALSERVRQRMCTHLIATYAATEITPLASAPAHRIVGTKVSIVSSRLQETTAVAVNTFSALKPGDTDATRASSSRSSHWSCGSGAAGVSCPMIVLRIASPFSAPVGALPHCPRPGRSGQWRSRQRRSPAKRFMRQRKTDTY